MGMGVPWVTITGVTITPMITGTATGTGMSISTAEDRLKLAHWLSPAFPIGGFAYSQGLEQPMAMGQVRTADQVDEWVRDCLCFPGHLEGIQRTVGERMIAADPDPDAKRAQLEAAGYFKVTPSFFDFPLYYIANSMAVVGPDVDVMWPAFSQFIDYELLVI